MGGEEGVNGRDLWSHASGSRKSELEMPAGLVSTEASLRDLQKACIHDVHPSVLSSSSCKDASQIGLGPP